MNKRNSVIFFAVVLSCIFSFIYAGIFMMIEPDKTTLKLTLNQVGIYQSVENAQATANKLTELNLKPLIYQKDSLQIVVCSLSQDVSQTEAEQKTLTEANITYIFKEYEISDEASIQALQAGDYPKVLELMSN